VQLFCIFIGLWVCIPAALLQKKTTDLSANASGWIGEIGGLREKLLWVDCMLLLIFGGIPWQVRLLVLALAQSSCGKCRSLPI
jgi:high affinity choline transporter 7